MRRTVHDYHRFLCSGRRPAPDLPLRCCLRARGKEKRCGSCYPDIALAALRNPSPCAPKRRVPHADICSAPDHAPHHLPPRPAGKGKGKGKKTSSKKTSKTPSKTPRTSALPAGWEELSDDDTGATYFYNSLTEEVSI